jgi:hypothetical protein
MDFTLPYPIGAVQIINVFEYYDGPKVFACENITGQKFIVNWIDTNSFFDKWFFVPVSPTRFLNILNGQVSLRDCIMRSESNLVLEVRTPKGESTNVQIDFREVNTIGEDELPDPDSFVEIEHQESTLPAREETTLLSAARSGRDVLDLSLKASDQNSSDEVDAGLLGEVLISTQNLAYFIGANTVGERGPISKNVMKSNKLKASGFFAASFGVRLKSEVSRGLFEDTDASNTLEKLMELFESTLDESRFRNVIKGLSNRALKTYYSLLNKLDNENVKIMVEWASPNQKYKQAMLDSKNIKSAIDILIKETITESKELEINGVLVGADTETNRFHLVSEDQENIHGVISEKLKDATFTVPMKVKAVVEQKLEIHLYTEEEKTTYTLISFET